MKRFLLLICLLELIFTVPGFSIAEEEKEIKDIQLEEMVVTANRTERRTTDVAVSITVISKEQIEADGAILT